MRFSPKFLSLLSILMLFCAGIILAKEEKALIILAAQEAQYDSKNNVIFLTGGVKLAYEGEVLEADSVIYDRNKDKVTAKGNVVLHRNDKSRFQAEYFELTSNFKKGVAKELTALLNKTARVSGRKMNYNSKGTTVLDKALYSMCENCKKKKNGPLVWQIRADKFKYDHKNEYMTYQNAFIEFNGVPVLYTPYFAHLSPKRERGSGFLFPKYGHSTDLGMILIPGYVWAISPSKELLLKTVLTSRAGQILWGTYSARLMNGEAKLDMSIGSVGGTKNRTNLLYNEKKETDRIKKRGWRGHGNGYVKKDLNDKWRASANLDWASDRTYFAKYNMLRQGAPTLLESNVNFEFFDDQNFANIKSASYQNLSTQQEVDVYSVPAVLPLGYGSFVFVPSQIGGHIELVTFATQMLYPHSFLERRAFVGTNWTRKFFITGGHDIMLQVGGMADGYAVTSSFSKKYKDLNVIKNDNSVGRLYPKASLFWRWPIVASGEKVSCIFEPVLGTVATPVLQKKYTEMINASSMLVKSFELNDVNYSSPYYYNNMTDYMDNGSRVVCGLNTTTYYKSKKVLRTVIGQNYNLSAPQLNLYPTSGIRYRWSNLVGSFETYPSERSRVYYRYSYSQKTKEMTKQEAGLALTIFKDTNISFDIFNGQHYALIDTKKHYKGYRGFLDAPIAGYWRGNCGVVVGENYKALDYHVGAKYEDECFVFNIWMERSAYIINDVRPSTNIMFLIELKSIGQW